MTLTTDPSFELQPSDYVAFVYHHSDSHVVKIKLFVLRMPKFGEPGFYHMHTSLTWFRERETKRKYGKQNTIALSKTNPVEVYVSTSINTKDFKSHQEDCETHPEVVTDVFKFYELIGYDRKKKKYI